MSDRLRLPKGFRFTGVHAGLKDGPGALDMAVIFSEKPCAAAGVFTSSHFPGEPVKLARERLALGRLQAMLVNSRISNVGTGIKGYEQARRICAALAGELGISEKLVLISSTGIIGRLYPEGRIEAAIPAAVRKLGSGPKDLKLAARAIMTTDTVPKCFTAKAGKASIALIAKGSGMIAPNMATMLAFIMTDARLRPAAIRPMLKRVADATFNRISVDSDMSTSDSCFLMANGEAGAPPGSFEKVLLGLCQKAALALVKDGEGVEKIIECRVSGASGPAMARAVARSVIDSPLVKTMVTGADPNWGRLLMAIGKVQSEPGLAGCKPDIKICGERVFRAGAPCKHDGARISRSMKKNAAVEIRIDLRLGKAEATEWGGNLTNSYVSINAHYTT